MLSSGVNTYASLEYINDYLNLDFDARESYSALNEDEKELYAQMAVRIIDREKWVGVRSNSNQKLEFPRDFSDRVHDPRRAINIDYWEGFETKNPYLTNSNVIFEDLKKAQCEIISYLLTTKSNDSVDQLTTLNNKANVESFKVGSLSFTFKESGGESLPLPEKAYNLLRNYLEGESDIIRIERG